MAFGEILRKAREARGLSFSQVAEYTHIKVQLIEDLEKEDFKKIAAPIYGRSFVKLYAEFLELDAVPLVRDFMELYTGARVPPVSRRTVETAPVEPPTPITRTVSDAKNPRPVARPIVRPVPVEPPAAPAPAVEPAPVAPAVAVRAENPVPVAPVAPAPVVSAPVASAPVASAPVAPAPVVAKAAEPVPPAAPAPVVVRHVVAAQPMERVEVPPRQEPAPVEVKPLDENIVEDLKAENEPNLFNRGRRAPIAVEPEESIPQLPREPRLKKALAHLREKWAARSKQWSEAAEQRRLHRATRRAERAAAKAERDAERAEAQAARAEAAPAFVEKRHEKVQALTEGLKRISQNLGRGFPDRLPRRTWLIAGVGAGLLLVFILVGVGVLYSVKGNGRQGFLGKKPGVPIVSPVPDFYAD